MSSLEPSIHPLIEQFVSERRFYINEEVEKENRLLHYIFPEIIQENINELNAFFSKHLDEFDIYFANKPTKSKEILKYIKKNNLKIDVASENELINALRIGFRFDEIECTGPKNKKYIDLAIKNNCLISIDSEKELEYILTINKKNPIQLRIANPQTNKSNLKLPLSRFGIPLKNIKKIIKQKGPEDMNLQGFHFHNDIRDSHNKADSIKCCLELTELAINHSHNITLLNIGGGLRDTRLKNLNQWQKFIEQLEEDILKGNKTQTWKDNGLGITLNAKGRITGREKLEGAYNQPTYYESLSEAFNQNYKGNTIKNTINEYMLKVIIEPGTLLLKNCGFSAAKVTDIKTLTNEDELIILNANRTNFSTSMNKLYTNPISTNPKKNEKPKSYFLAGNLCQEEDMLSQKKLHIQNKVNTKDSLLFIDTISKYTDFEDASPHQHPTSKRKIITKKNNKWVNKNDYI